MAELFIPTVGRVLPTQPRPLQASSHNAVWLAGAAALFFVAARGDWRRISTPAAACSCSVNIVVNQGLVVEVACMKIAG